MLAHSDNFPVTENWIYLIDEVIESVKSSSTEPVIALGHSLGGILSLLASYKAPELFKMVVMLDAPVMSRFKSMFIKLLKQIGLIDAVTPAKKTKTRKETWHSKEEAASYLRSRPLFQKFTEECMQDYLIHGLHQGADSQCRLRFDKRTEYVIYRTFPHNLPSYKGKPKVPTVLMYGDKTDVVTRYDRYIMRKFYDIIPMKCSGSHMFPMEHPDETSESLIRIIKHYLNENR